MRILFFLILKKWNQLTTYKKRSWKYEKKNKKDYRVRATALW